MPPFSMEVNMNNEKRLIGDYEILTSIRVGKHEIVLAENPNAVQYERFLCGYVENNGVFERLVECAVSDSYADVATLFGERVTEKSEEAQKDFEREKEIVGDNREMKANECEPITENDLLKGRVVVIRGDALRSEFSRAAHQMYLCVGGFGSQPNARGRSCFCRSLYDGHDTTFQRQDILGVFPTEQLPEWAVDGLKEARAKEKRDRGDR